MARGRRRPQPTQDEDSDDGNAAMDVEEDNEEEEEEAQIGSSASTALNNNSHQPTKFSYSNVSVQSAHSEKDAILQPLEQLKEMLIALLNKLKSNKEEMPADLIVRWKERILEISQKIILIEFEFKVADVASNAFLNEYIQKENIKFQNPNHSFLITEDDENTVPNTGEMMKQLKTKIDAQLQKLNVFDDNFMKKVQQISKKLGGQEEDDLEEDLEIMENEEELTESYFTCPYTRTKMTEAIKNINPRNPCIHRVSREAVNAMLNTGKTKNEAKCPVAGCQGVWLKGHIAVDESFAHKWKKFQKQQTLKSQILGSYATQSSSTQPAIALDDD